ncbi:MAG: DUF6745 domain-containing protein [Pseudomonadota bacterium]
MAKITKLTPQQEAMIPAIREQFRAEALRTDPINKEQAKAAVIALYETAGLNAPRLTLVAQSPMQAQMMRALLAGDQDQLWGQLRGQLWGQLRGQLGVQLGVQLWGQLRGQLGVQLGDQLKSYDGNYFDGAWDGSWLAFYDFPRRLGVEYEAKTNARLDAYLNYSRKCGVAYLYPTIAIICDRPSIIRFDDQRRLHHDDGPALQWRDGYTIHAWHGTRLPPEWFYSDELSAKTILAHENVEQRAAGIQYYGIARLLDDLEHRIIDSDPDPLRGDLVGVKIPGLRTEGRYLKAHCPRNGTIMEAVPPVSDINGQPIETVLAAQAWRVRMTPDQFTYPSIRT